MKITLRMTSGRTLQLKEPPAGQQWIETRIECPSGGHYLDVRGLTTHKGERSCSGSAVCMACGLEVGTIIVKYDTIFGITEDRAVLTDGRWRVY